MAANFGVTQVLLLANLVVMSFIAWSSWRSANASIQLGVNMEDAFIMPKRQESSNNQRMDRETASVIDDTAPKILRSTPFDTALRPVNKYNSANSTTGRIGSTNSAGFYFVHPKEGERDFYNIGKTTHTDKVAAPGRLPGCLQNSASCTRPNCTRPECRPWGHHYDTIYQQRLGPYSRDDVEPFQFLEIGFYHGDGYDTVSD